MKYTDKQYKMMERLEHGVYWKWFVDLPEDEVIRFLRKEALCETREDIAPNLLRLSQRGESVLEAYRQECNEKAQIAAEKHRQEIQRIKERKQERRDKWLIAIFSTCFGYVLRLCIEHSQIISVFFRNLFHW